MDKCKWREKDFRNLEIHVVTKSNKSVEQSFYRGLLCACFFLFLKWITQARTGNLPTTSEAAHHNSSSRETSVNHGPTGLVSGRMANSWRLLHTWALAFTRLAWNPLLATLARQEFSCGDQCYAFTQHSS